MKDDLGTSCDWVGFIRDNSESASGIGLPSVLDVLVAFGNDSDSVGNKICGVETNSKLTNHADISSSSYSLHESSSSGFGNST